MSPAVWTRRIGNRDVEMGRNRTQETALDGGAIGDIRAAGDPQHPGLTVDRLGDGDLEVEAELIDCDGLGDDVEAVGLRKLRGWLWHQYW